MILPTKAAQLLAQGGVVAFPTETVWGLGACAFDNDACKRIYSLKGRPSNNPLIVHVSTISEAEKLVEFNEAAHKLAALMPGPLTLVLPMKKDAGLAQVVTAGLDSLAIRIPASATAQELIKQLGAPIAAPSVNKSNYISSTNESHVQVQFAPEIAAGHLVIVQPVEEDICYGLESTIVDCTRDNELAILRSGFVLPEALQKVSGIPVYTVEQASKVIAPGMMKKHYAPHAPLSLNRADFKEDELVIAFGHCSHEHMISLSKSSNMLEAAAGLYAALHKADNIVQTSPHLHSIAVMPIPNRQIGIAINDRLKRAASEE